MKSNHFSPGPKGRSAFGRNAALLRGMVLTIFASMWVLIAAHADRPDRRLALAHSARGRTGLVVRHRRSGPEDVRSRRRWTGCARTLRRSLRACGHRPSRLGAAVRPARAPVGRGPSRAGLHAPAQSHPRIRRVAARRGDSPLSRAGADAVGLPRALRARAVAQDESAAASGAGSPRLASSTRSRNSRPCAGTTRSGPFPRSAPCDR